MILRRRHQHLVRVLVPLAVVLGIGIALPLPAAADAVPGSAGTETSLPSTPSEVTVNGRGAFASLRVTVNQTKNLTNQAVSIAWSGAEPTIPGPGRFARNYLQVMQCWGDPVDDPEFAENPGPPPEKCVYGAYSGANGIFPPGSATVERIISRTGWPEFDADEGAFDPRTGLVWRAFVSVDGTTIGTHKNPSFNPSVGGGNFWLNQYFNPVTTNEINGARTAPDGRGTELFELQTGVQSSGLGCGQRVEPTPSGEKRIPRCWIVVVPRGAPTEENVGSPFVAGADQLGVMTSPLAPAAWKNRIAIPIEFNPVDSACSIADEERRLAGTELVIPALSSWQPALCGGEDLPPYSFVPVSDASARQLLVSPTIGSPGMVVVSRPIPPENIDPMNPVVYAPVSLSGLVVAFNVERVPRTDSPQEEQDLAGVRVSEMNLTPRLVAKLLTQSYQSAVNIIEPSPYTWTGRNPRHLGLDPDFVRFNPEFALLESQNARAFSSLQLPAGSSDAARQVWEWILSDPEAKAWLDGAPDPWGMRVNPVYATSAEANTYGLPFADPIPSSFPKADPYCYQARPVGDGTVIPPLLCGTDWVPYARSMADAAQITRVAADRPRIVSNVFALTAGEAWSREPPQILGSRSILALTDTPSASLFGLQMARLSRAGDNGPDREFVAADTRGLLAGVGAMEAGAVPNVLEPRYDSLTRGAYPLTVLAYAATAPLALDERARAEYAAFVDYAASAGQEPGFTIGDLPAGYAPLPFGLRVLSARTAEVIRVLEPPPPVPALPEPSPTSTTTAPVPPTTAAPVTTLAPPPTVAATAAVRPATTSPRPVAATTSPPATSAPTVPPPPPEAPPQPTEPPATALVAAPTTAAPVPVEVEPTAMTPGFAMGLNRFAAPALLAVALAAGLLALEITKAARRAVAADAPAPVPEPVEPGAGPEGSGMPGEV